MTTHGNLLAVIDPQRAFVDPAGSLALAYGLDDVRPSIEALERASGALLPENPSQDLVYRHPRAVRP